jgi:hypothetical protein
MELVEEARALADHGLEPTGDVAEAAEFERQGRVRGGRFGQREAGGRVGFEGIGLLAAQESGAVVLVALRIAAGEGEGEGTWRAVRARSAQAVQKTDQVLGILPGRIEADNEMNGAVALDDAFEPLAEEGVAGGGFREREFGGSRLEVVLEEDGTVAVA